MDDEAETYRLWRVRKTVMQVDFVGMKSCVTVIGGCKVWFTVLLVSDSVIPSARSENKVEITLFSVPNPNPVLKPNPNHKPNRPTDGK